MPYLPKALIACCECVDRQILADLVARCGFKPMIATSTSDAVSRLRSESTCIAFCHDELPGDGFKAVLKAAVEVAAPVVIASRLDDAQRYLESMQLGAFDFICLPYSCSEVSALATAMLRYLSPLTAQLDSATARVA